MDDATYRIIIFGEKIVARKALAEGFLMGLFEPDPSMTIGVDYFVKSLNVDSLKLNLQILYFGGEAKFRFLLPTYVKQARAGIFLYDATNYATIKHIDDWLSLISKGISEKDIFPIIVVGIVPDEEGERQVSREEGIKIAKSSNVNSFVECNLKTGDNVEKMFELLARLMLAYFGYHKIPECVKAKDEEYLITYTRNLEKELRYLEAENVTLENRIKELKLEKELRLKQDLNNIQDRIDKYKKM